MQNPKVGEPGIKGSSAARGGHSAQTKGRSNGTSVEATASSRGGPAGELWRK